MIMMMMKIASYIVLLMISFGFEKTNGLQKAYYGVKTPYKPPPPTLVLPSPPTGFQQVCSQALVRHGCRTIADPHAYRLTVALWKQAKKEGALTEFGEQFGEDLRYFNADNSKLGIGDLSGLGELEQQGLAHRLTKRLSKLFKKSISHNSSKSIQVVTNGNTRVTQSLNAFLRGLPSRIIPLINFEPPNPRLLHYFNSREHQMYLENNTQIKDKIRTIQVQPHSQQMARNVLERLYNKSFVDKLANGDYSILDSTSGQSIKNEMDAIFMFHSIYLTGAELREEGVGSLLEKYFHPKESAWFAYLYDARDYYMRGPSFTNQTATFDIAQVLLDDFVRDSDRCSQVESTHFLRARFTDANEFLPFAALLKIPDLTDKQTPANETYTYQNNEWRGDVISPMSASVQWDIYRHRSYGKTRSSQHQQILIQMLLNERPIRFQRDCEPYNSSNPFFYTLDELKRCYKINDG